MAYSVIKKPSDYFNTVLYTGNGSTQSITGVKHQPDLTWLKCRSNADGHGLFDAVRGVNKRLISDTAEAEATISGVTSFDSDGFSLGSAKHNDNGLTFVGWNWKANGTGVSNTDGSITSTVSANTTSGFSIATFTTPSSGTVFDVGHGLGGKPDMMIMKSRGSAADWWTWHIGLGDNTTDYLSLNNSNAENSISGMWGTVGAGTSTFGYTAGTSAYGGIDNVAYFFKSIKGFSKFGSYTGNGNNDGTFVYTGFKPAFVMIKRSSSLGTNWTIMDNKRDIFNPETKWLYPNVNDAEATPGIQFDFLSNGFKPRTNGTYVNTSGETYIYMAFAENPLVTSTKLPATAR